MAVIYEGLYNMNKMYTPSYIFCFLIKKIDTSDNLKINKVPIRPYTKLRLN